MMGKKYCVAMAGILTMLVLGAMYAWSYFKVALHGAYPEWSQTQITLNFTLLMICFCFGGLIAGTILKSFSKKVILIVSALFIFCGFLGTALLPAEASHALIQLYLCYGILTGFGTGIAYNVVLAIVPLWFPKKPGLVSGAMLMSLGFGALILGLIVSRLIENIGLSKTFFVFAFAVLIVMVICSFVLKLPSAIEQSVPAKKHMHQSKEELTTKQMLKKGTFWLLLIWNICIASCGMLVINAASSICVYYGLFAVLGLLVSVFNGCGRLLIGYCMDRLGGIKTMLLNTSLLLVASIILLTGDRSGVHVIVILGMLLMGICYGGGITICAALARQLYGNTHYASNFAVCNLSLVPASIVGPILSARLQDLSGGGYMTTFMLVILLGVVALGSCMIFLGLIKSSKIKNNE